MSSLPLLPLAKSETVRLRGWLDVPLEETAAWLAERGQPPHRAKQIRRWILVAGAESWDDMTDLPKALRQQLAESFAPIGARVARHLQADDGTHKLLIELADGKLVECVLIQEANRRTACVSTQVGCGMGCVFCASGINGVDRNLSPGEILEQLVRLRNLPTYDPIRKKHLVESGERVDRLTHIVVMGMGEPLANLENLLAALDVATAKDGLGIGGRHVTISSVGLPAKIRQLADLGKSYHLAVSLHAPDDELRTEIVPTNDKVGLGPILAAADYFLETTGRQVTFEYVLLGGVNDGFDQARALGRLLQGRGAHVNLIPFNDVVGLPYRRPSADALTRFQEALRNAGVSVKVRKRKGAQIDAACGQLRRAAMTSSSPLPGGERGARPVWLESFVAMTGESSSQMALRDPDIRLMLRVRDDDEAAFAELVELYHRRLVIVMQHLVGRGDEAEDLAQEVFLRIFRGRKKYHPRAKFSTWLFTIANNLALNHLRNRQRKPVVPLNTRDSGPLGARPAEQLVQGREHAPHHAMQEREIAAVVRQALETLNERQKVAVVLNKFEDMNYAEIAEVMGLSTKAVKSLLSRARENLRLALKDYIEIDTREPGDNS